MKKFVTNVKERLVNPNTLIKSVLIGTMLVNVTFAADDTVKTILEKVFKIIGAMFVGVGAILTVYSLFNLIMSFKSDDPNGQSQASKNMFIGIILMALPPIINNLGLINIVNNAITNVTN